MAPAADDNEIGLAVAGCGNDSWAGSPKDGSAAIGVVPFARAALRAPSSTLSADSRASSVAGT
jgi:hypothetical protein